MLGRLAQAHRLVEADVVAALPRLRRYARVLTGDDARADALVAETLASAWKSRRAWHGGPNARTWLFGVMHGLHGRMPRADTPPSIDDTAAGADIRARLAQLPVDEREVLMLVAVERMAYDEIGRLLGVPVATVVSTLTRAREHLGAMG